MARIAVITSGATANCSCAAKPRRAQHPQRVIAERVLRPTRRTDEPLRKVLAAAVRVGELAPRHTDRHRVDGEVPPAQVVDQALAVLDHWIAADPVVRIGPERCDLQPEAAPLCADGAELAPGLPYRLRPTGEYGERLVRVGVRGEVQIVTEPPEQRVAYGSADEVQLVPGPLRTAGRARRRPVRSATTRRVPSAPRRSGHPRRCLAASCLGGREGPRFRLAGAVLRHG